VHPPSAVDAALKLAEAGARATDIARRLEIPRSTVRDWLAGSVPNRPPPEGCGSGGVAHRFAELTPAYVYLLGMYLGDGYIAAHARGVYALRFSLDMRYPAIIEECAAAIREIAPANRVGSVSRHTWIELYCWSKGWPRLFPQHGPGKKHERAIMLVPWQQELVDRWPEQILRGLIHSDGCRFQNTGRGGWSWPRYAFSNRSADIHSIFCRACEQLGLHWTASGSDTTYVSRKADVATLDSFIGPKH
jgi:hypothetical protein